MQERETKDRKDKGSSKMKRKEKKRKEKKEYWRKHGSNCICIPIGHLNIKLILYKSIVYVLCLQPFLCANSMELGK